MVVDYLFRVGHAAVNDLDGISVEDFSELVTLGKVLVYQGEEFVSDVGAGVLAKKEGCTRGCNCVVGFFSYCSVQWCPLSSGAFLYGGAAWSKDVLSGDRDDIRLLMLAGMFFMVIGGWLLSAESFPRVEQHNIRRNSGKLRRRGNM